MPRPSRAILTDVRSPAAICRSYAISGAAWAVVAALAALLGWLEIVGLPVPGLALGAGRWNAVYIRAAFFGAASLPLAGALLVASGFGRLPAPRAQGARLGMALWNAGVLGGLPLVDAWARPEGWGASSLVGDALMWAGSALWALALWRAVTHDDRPMPVAAWFGLAGAIGLVVYLGLGTALVGGVTGAGQAVAGALYRRGLPALWAAPAGLGVAAAVLPAAIGAPLFGRRAAAWGLAGWVALGALAVPRDLAPDLLPGWLARPVEAATLLAVVPAALLAVALLGAFVGAGEVRRDADGGSDADAAGSMPAGTDMPALGPPVSRTIARFVATGTLALLAAAVFDAALPPDGRRVVQLTAWDPATGLFPPLVGIGLLATGAGYAVLQATGARVEALSCRRHLTLAVLGGLLVALPLPAIGLVEAATDVGRTMQAVGLVDAAQGSVAAQEVGRTWLRVEAWARLPGAALVAAAAIAGILHVRRATRGGRFAAPDNAASGPADPPAGAGSTRDGPGSAPDGPGRTRDGHDVAVGITLDPWAAGREPGPSAAWIAGAMLAAIGAALFATLFLPLADPSALRATPRAAARATAGDSVRAEGRQTYVAEGCAACHTQRVRDAADEARFGPRTARGDYAPGPALVGYRRAGPDLAWIGDRLDGDDALAARLVGAHGPLSAPRFPWLFEAGGPSARGMAVVAYLSGLRSDAWIEEEGGR